VPNQGSAVGGGMTDGKFHLNPANEQSTGNHNTYKLFRIYSIPTDDGLHMCQKHVEC